MEDWAARWDRCLDIYQISFISPLPMDSILKERRQCVLGCFPNGRWRAWVSKWSFGRTSAVNIVILSATYEGNTFLETPCRMMGATEVEIVKQHHWNDYFPRLNNFLPLPLQLLSQGCFLYFAVQVVAWRYERGQALETAGDPGEQENLAHWGVGLGLVRFIGRVGLGWEKIPAFMWRHVWSKMSSSFHCQDV